MKILSIALSFFLLSPLASRASLTRGGGHQEKEKRDLQSPFAPVCDGLYSEVRGLCETVGCDCTPLCEGEGCDVQCENKGIRLQTFSTVGQDSEVVDVDDGSLAEGDANDPLEVRFNLFDNVAHYPTPTANSCGARGTRTLGGILYCVTLFGETMNTSDAAYKLLPANSRTTTIPFTFFESDNVATDLFTVEGNLNPNEWYVSGCRTYDIVVYKSYAGFNNNDRRGVCYDIIDGGGPLNLDILNIRECFPNGFFPQNNYYTFRFRVTPANLV